MRYTNTVNIGRVQLTAADISRITGIKYRGARLRMQRYLDGSITKEELLAKKVTHQKKLVSKRTTRRAQVKIEGLAPRKNIRDLKPPTKLDLKYGM